MTEYLFIGAFILFQIAFLIQVYYILMVHQKLGNYKKDNVDNVKHPVSVIICARNEEQNLEQNLASVLEQDYPNFEVVVVNDCSVDDSGPVLRSFSQKYPNLKIVTLTEHERFKHGKKFAVTLGIKAAANEHLLFTDADCKPSSPNWITQMQRNFNGSKQIILGYSPYTIENGFLNKLIRFETFYTALNYFSFALAGTPYMGVGRNMAYTKSLFFKGKGFASHMHIPSGDDDLFVNQNANPNNVAIELDTEAQVWTEPKKTFLSYFKQKIRHMGAGRVYKTKHKRMLSLLTGSAIVFYICLFTLLALKAQWWLLLIFVGLRLAMQIVIYLPAFKKLSYGGLIWWLPALDLIYNFYILVVSIISLFKKTVKWK